MIDYVRELPEWANLSGHLVEQADGFLTFYYSGKQYCIPLTKQMKKVFGISRRGNEINWSFKQEQQFENILMTVASSLYLQTRDTVGAGIKEDIMRTVQEGIEKMLAPKIYKEIEDGFQEQEKLLRENNEKSQETH